MSWTPDTLKEYIDRRIEAVERLITALDGWVHDKLSHTLGWTDESRRKVDSLATREETARTEHDLLAAIEELRARLLRMEGVQTGRGTLVATLIAIAAVVSGAVVGILHLILG